jgi:methylmalonyl-CoA mutase cobalamin-binding subunit
VVLGGALFRTRQRDGRLGDLAQIVDGQIIPNLMRAHGHDDGVQGRGKGADPGINDADIEVFTALAIGGRVEALMDFAARRLAEGVARESLYDGLAASAERLLDAWWRDDRCRSADVTVGRCVLRQFLRELSREERPAMDAPLRSAFISALPGETESFGQQLTEAAFGRAGWRAVSEPAVSCRQMAGAVGSEWFDVMGLSLASREQLRRVPEIVQAVHDSSRNRSIRIILCGRICLNHPEFSALAGADAAADEGMAAVAAAQATLSRIANDP